MDTTDPDLHRRPLIVGDHFITVPVSNRVATVIGEFIRKHQSELDTALESHGISTAEIAVPTFERIVYADEAQ